MKKFTIFVTAVFAAAAMLTIASCGKNDKDEIKNIEKPTHSATADQAGDFKAFADAVEESDNVNGMRFDLTIQGFTTDYNNEKRKRGQKDLLDPKLWVKDGENERDGNGVEVQYWHYNDENVSFTASVEAVSSKIINIGCGTTMRKFMETTDSGSNSDVILEQAALMAQVACGFPSERLMVMQDIFYRTTTGSNDTLWFKGYVFNLSTKEDKEDSKNSVMLFRVYPITDELRNEWKLEEYNL